MDIIRTSSWSHRCYHAMICYPMIIAGVIIAVLFFILDSSAVWWEMIAASKSLPLSYPLTHRSTIEWSTKQLNWPTKQPTNQLINKPTSHPLVISSQLTNSPSYQCPTPIGATRVHWHRCSGGHRRTFGQAKRLTVPQGLDDRMAGGGYWLAMTKNDSQGVMTCND